MLCKLLYACTELRNLDRKVIAHVLRSPRSSASKPSTSSELGFAKETLRKRNQDNYVWSAANAQWSVRTRARSKPQSTIEWLTCTSEDPVSFPWCLNWPTALRSVLTPLYRALSQSTVTTNLGRCERLHARKVKQATTSKAADRVPRRSLTRR